MAQVMTLVSLETFIFISDSLSPLSSGDQSSHVLYTLLTPRFLESLKSISKTGSLSRGSDLTKQPGGKKTGGLGFSQDIPSRKTDVFNCWTRD